MPNTPQCFAPLPGCRFRRRIIRTPNAMEHTRPPAVIDAYDMIVLMDPNSVGRFGYRFDPLWRRTY